jgi:dTDP-4-dehydrorhamnose 3,5-epimerase-like enzyme
MLVTKITKRLKRFPDERGTYDAIQKLDAIVSAGKNIQFVRIPRYYRQGYKIVDNKPAFLIYFVDRLYDCANQDELRRLWNDQTVKLSSVNREMNNPKVGKSYCNNPPNE